MTIRGRIPRVRVDLTPAELFTADAALRYYRDTFGADADNPARLGPSIRQADALVIRLRRIRTDVGLVFPYDGDD